MNPVDDIFKRRADDKQRSREADEALLRSGRASRVDLRKANGMASALPLSKFRVVAIGGRDLAKDREPVN